MLSDPISNVNLHKLTPQRLLRSYRMAYLERRGSEGVEDKKEKRSLHSEMVTKFSQDSPLMFLPLNL
jgi:hypothetical protein